MHEESDGVRTPSFEEAKVHEQTRIPVKRYETTGDIVKDMQTLPR